VRYIFPKYPVTDDALGTRTVRSLEFQRSFSLPSYLLSP
jgi:hypothetical protein